MKAPIVLLTDYGLQDPYAGILRGVIASIAPEARVIDLTHGLSSFDIRQASIYLETSYRYFPRGSFFVCVVDPGVGTARKLICAKSRNYYFAAPDNGLLTDVKQAEPFKEIRVIDNREFTQPKISGTFHGRDILAPAAAHLFRNPSIFKRLGPAVKNIIQLPAEEPVRISNGIKGKILFFDHFGNAITNIRRNLIPAGWEAFAKVLVGKTELGTVRSYYWGGGKFIALWNSMDRLEIASPRAKASDFFKKGDSVNVAWRKYETKI